MANDVDLSKQKQKQKEKTSGGLVGNLKARLPPWMSAALSNPRAWKTLARCWLASWATFLLLLPDTSLRALGNAAFFGVIASLILPPSMPLQMFVFAILTLVTGMGVGWAWGAAAMKAGLTARSQTFLASQIQRAQQGAAGAANPDAVFQLDVFQGFFIDWRSSVVYGFFLAVGACFFALVRAYSPRLQLFSVFGTIVLDVFCTFGPLLPSPSYTIISSFFISTGCYAAIALACIVLVFPETLQHAYLDGVEALLGSMKGYVDFQEEVLDVGGSGEGGEGENGGRGEEGRKERKKRLEDLEKRSTEKRTGILLALQGLTARTPLVDAEFTFGRWSGRDCASLEEPLKVLTSRLASIHSFVIALSLSLDDGSANDTGSSGSSSTSSLPSGAIADSNDTTDAAADDLTRHLFLASSSPHPHPHRRPSSSTNQQQQRPHPTHPHPPSPTPTLPDLLPLLTTSTLPLRTSCTRTLAACARLLGAVNHGRWVRGARHREAVRDAERDVGGCVDELRRVLLGYKYGEGEGEGGRREIVEPFVPVLERYMHLRALQTQPLPQQNSQPTNAAPTTPTAPTLPLRPLIVASIFASHLTTLGDTILGFADALMTLSAKRRGRRVWAPGGMRALGKVVRFALGRRGVGVAGEDARLGVDDGGDGSVSGSNSSSSSAETLALGLDAGATAPGGKGVEKETKGKAKGENKKEKIGEKEEKEKEYKKDPDSRPPENAFQRVMDANHRLWKWLHTAEATFMWKYTLITVVLWFPSTLTSFAHFYYVEKGVWALIMAQTTMNIYMSDQIYNYAARLFGTFVGLLVGLVGWYAGNGRGNGSAYGSAAAMAVVLLPVVFARINVPLTSLVPVMMCSATLVLIIGYSWIDGHLVTISSPGIGWSIAWKRWVLVVIGCGASFVLMMIPPTSARKAVRLKNAAIISELSSLYTLLMSAWIMDEEGEEGAKAENAKNSTGDARPKPTSDVTTGTPEDTDIEKNTSTSSSPASPPKWAVEFRRRLIPLATQLQALRAQTATAKWEGNLRGAWPVEAYDALVSKESEMLMALAQLSSALQHLSAEWRVSLNRGTLVLNPEFITDVMSIFALVSQSLRTGEPLHQILPSSLLDRMLYHQTHKELALSASGRSIVTSHFSDAQDESRSQKKVDPVERIRSPEFMYYATGIAAVAHLITCLDEMHRITKDLCGEVPFRGFEEWKAEYDRVYELHQ